RLDRGRDAAQRLQLGLVRAQLGGIRQLAVHQQVGDLLELAGPRQVEDVVAAVVQVVAAAANRAQRGVAGGGARQGDGLLRLEAGRGGGIGHVGLRNGGERRGVAPAYLKRASRRCSKAW